MKQRAAPLSVLLRRVTMPSSLGSSLDRAYVPGAADLPSPSRQRMVHAGIRHEF
ncbi:porin [Burkholderia diffusa]|uniref:Porin n=1 Tax=Burkholderia diffusa TaxID=488732 RepID=A0A6P2MWK8_9BURK|nr:hypothetical protein [Burkholderia diffusa]MBM2655411.1 hypothetical protein [Burkholderia diffusa]VWB86284.1 porin [Burkholderia diffusa]